MYGDIGESIPMAHGFLGYIYQAPGVDPYADLRRRNLIEMHATVLMAKYFKLTPGVSMKLRGFEDCHVYLRQASRGTIDAHPAIFAEYRWHGGNVSADTSKMLRAVSKVDLGHRP